MFQKRAIDFSFALFAFFAVSSILVGCGNLFHMTPSKPQLYRVQGRALDGITRKGLSKARILLRATIPTQMDARSLTAAGSTEARGGGVVLLSNYGVADDDGTFTVELSEGFEVVRNAKRIRLEVSMPGYASAGIDLPPPAKEEPFYKAPDIFMVQGSPGPASTLPRGVNMPGGPRPTKPNPIPWK